MSGLSEAVGCAMLFFCLFCLVFAAVMADELPLHRSIAITLAFIPVLALIHYFANGH